MTPSDRLYYAYMAEPVSEGRRSPYTPAHLTLVPPFAATIDVARSALATAVTGQRPFTVHATELTYFGPRGDIPVYLVEPVEELRRMHERLITEIEARGVSLVNDHHVHERFVPHIRIRPRFPDFPPIHSGQVFTIDHVALMHRSDRWRTVVAKEVLSG
jgi:2'-5' RNA ligase